MSEKKILILTNRIPYPLKDGGNLAMDTIIRGYHEMGWKVYLLSMNTTRHHVSQQILESMYQYLHAFEWVNFDNRYNFLTIAKNFFFSAQPEHADRFYNLEFKTKLKQVLADFVPDVVQVESVFLSTYLPEIREVPGVITALRLHNIEYHIWQSLSLKIKNRIKRYYFKDLAQRIRHFEHSNWKKYDLLLPITHKDAATVTKMKLPNEMVIAPFGIDVSKIEHNHTIEKWSAYHLGAMDWIPNREGIQWFIEKVWPRVHKALPKLEFFFAGRHMPDYMMAYNGNGVHCMDEVADANEFIADKKILIVPLWSGSGIRIKILEAMAAGKIVITTVNGIKGISAMHNVHYLVANRPEDFLRNIKWCLENKEEAEKIAENGRKLVIEKYNYLTIAKDITGKLDEMIANS